MIGKTDSKISLTRVQGNLLTEFLWDEEDLKLVFDAVVDKLNCLLDDHELFLFFYETADKKPIEYTSMTHDQINELNICDVFSYNENSSVLSCVNMKFATAMKSSKTESNFLPGSHKLCYDFENRIPDASRHFSLAVMLEELNSPKESRLIKVDVPIDIMTTIPQSDLTKDTLMKLIGDYVLDMKQQTLRALELSEGLDKFSGRTVPSSPYHYLVKGRDDDKSRIYTAFYPDSIKDDGKLMELRKHAHELLDVPTDKPVFRRQNALKFSPLFTTQLVIDVSSTPEAPAPGSKGEGWVEETVKGPYAYYHYMQDGMNDAGWGCAYRSLQTLWSWFLIHGYTEKSVITHKDIQQTLVSIGDKPSNFVGSKQWIGSFEVSYVLDQHLGISCAFINVQSGSQLVSHAGAIAEHFRKHGTPIMVGGGVLAHTICGVAYLEGAEESSLRYLILDPHYTGVEVMKDIKKKSGFSWKPQTFWKPDAYYNLCLPQKPNIF